ncbi:hypothetical protein [Streptomyces profundus]|uniref:hypothetical protein n=1 Tax=Streptomyces profundus TaxID=2867410 RepID=UPI001D1650D5|nr:hypothetical protein [Streptomyces sp. MA3_2.13]UED86629.1 hypothetical protein K4G22_22530 [Streptomyces sp. MA3_2.13]
MKSTESGTGTHASFRRLALVGTFSLALFAGPALGQALTAGWNADSTSAAASSSTGTLGEEGDGWSWIPNGGWSWIPN